MASYMRGRKFHVENTILPQLIYWWETNSDTASYILSEHKRYKQAGEQVSIEEMSDPWFQSIFRDNVDALFGMSRIASDHWKKRGRLPHTSLECCIAYDSLMKIYDV
jgi:hypothetical protein